MVRKLMLAAVAVAAVGFGAQSAHAAPPIGVQPSIGGYLPPTYPRPFPTYPTFPQRRDAHDYEVLVRHGHHWDRHGRYETLREAERVERYLESRGLRARIEVIHDHR